MHQPLKPAASETRLSNMETQNSKMHLGFFLFVGWFVCFPRIAFSTNIVFRNKNINSKGPF